MTGFLSPFTGRRRSLLFITCRSALSFNDKITSVIAAFPLADVRTESVTTRNVSVAGDAEGKIPERHAVDRQRRFGFGIATGAHQAIAQKGYRETSAPGG